ncbi:MAG TPA: glycoside hydrolase family 78 protein [Armatimonadota bacterium]|nr:glycoside hydrolase family 78 protein [Armatimonadota bacterium]
MGRYPAIAALIGVMFSAVPGSAKAAAVQNLRCEYADNPVGIDSTQPRLSWMIQSQRRGERQTGYQILVASTPGLLSAGHGDLWNSGRVASDRSTQVVYSGQPLHSRERSYWKVRVWDRAGRPTAYSAPASWEMGLLKPRDWTASWISAPPTSGAMGPSPYLRKSFSLGRPIRRARIYVSALGLYELRLNGQRVGREVFAPGWTDYHHRVDYQVYDVTRMLKPGANAIGMILGDGWDAGYVASFGRNLYGKYPMAICQLEVEYTDGSRTVIGTDKSWKTANGPILQSDMLMGETYDARKELTGWDRPGFDDHGWNPVVAQTPEIELDAPRGPPVRVERLMPARSITEPKPGAYVFDIGQNMVGWARLKVKGPRGEKVTLRFAEMLNPDGTIYTANLRSARATDEYVLKGGATETYEPHFTYHGFRYVEVTGYPGRPRLSAITGVVVHSDIPFSSSFDCSNAMVDRLQQNILWGQRGNFMSVPTDCPQRDERLGWMGDAEIFAGTAAFNADVSGFYTQWLGDVRDTQAADGAYPDVAPRVGPIGAGTAGWGDAGVIVPWTVYLTYGDTRVIRENYSAMARWIEYCRQHSGGLLRPATGYGDWLAIGADTPKDVLSTAFFAYSDHLLARMAGAIGRTADAAKYNDLFHQIRAAFDRAYVGPDGRIKGDTQTDDALALEFDLLPAKQRATVAGRLVEDIRKRGWRLSTGFIGVGHLLPALTNSGNTSVAYRLLEQTQFPSWGYSINQGATTIWERWDGWTKEHGFQTPAMNSFNHYSLGSVGQWMYETVAGIAPDPAAPGYRHFFIRPEPGGGLTSARGAYESPYGRIESAWRLKDGRILMDVMIPPNSTATVTIPCPQPSAITESDKPARNANGVHFILNDDQSSVFEVGSGHYRFSAPAAKHP